MTFLANNPSTGLGALAAVPAGSVNGTALGSPPSGTIGVRLYLPAGASVSFTVAATPPAAPPSAVFTVAATAVGPNWDEALSAGQMIYVTASAGAPLFRWQ